MAIRYTIIFLSICLVIMFHGLLSAESENYCHDQESWKEWDALVEKNPNDNEVQTLHALRIGLPSPIRLDGGTLR